VCDEIGDGALDEMVVNEFSSLLESLGSLDIVLTIGLLLLELPDLTMTRTDSFLISPTPPEASFSLLCSRDD
jgi:hypothetical protein